MNSRTNRWLLITVLFVLGVLFLFVLSGRKPVGEPDQATLGASNRQDTAGVPKANPVSSRAVAATASNPPPITDQPALKTREQKLEQAPSVMNVTIDFYGRVVDQDNHPIPNVRVALSIRQWAYAATAGLSSQSPRTELTTDADGRFQFTGGKGDDLQIEALEKEGYEAETNALRGFGYTTSEKMTPDQNNPVVFRMWKTGVKQQVLITGNKFLPIVPDGRVYTMDLVKGVLSEGENEGDLRFSIKRPRDAAWGTKYDWSFSIEPVQGGIKEETDPYASMFIAPSDGYSPRFELDFHSTDENWSYGVQKRFYMQARSGQMCGRMEVEIDAYYLKDRQGRFGIKYTVNSKGGRNLR